MPPLSGSAAEARVAEWIAAQPAAVRELAAEAYALLLSADTRCEARWAFGGPFVYCAGKMFAFVAVTPGGQLHLGLCQGAQLDDPQGLLAATDRQLIRHYYVTASEDLAHEGLFELLQQQVQLIAGATARGESPWTGQLRPKRRR